MMLRKTLVDNTQPDFVHKEPSCPLIFLTQMFSGKMKGLAQRALESLKFAQNTNAALLAPPLGSAAVAWLLRPEYEVVIESGSLSRVLPFQTSRISIGDSTPKRRSCNFCPSWVVSAAVEL